MFLFHLETALVQEFGVFMPRDSRAPNYGIDGFRVSQRARVGLGQDGDHSHSQNECLNFVDLNG